MAGWAALWHSKILEYSNILPSSWLIHWNLSDFHGFLPKIHIIHSSPNPHRTAQRFQPLPPSGPRSGILFPETRARHRLGANTLDVSGEDSRSTPEVQEPNKLWILGLGLSRVKNNVHVNSLGDGSTKMLSISSKSASKLLDFLNPSPKKNHDRFSK